MSLRAAGTIAKLAFMSAICGPTLGTLLVSATILLDRVSGYWSHAKTGMEEVPAGWTTVAFLYYYGLFFAAPGAAAFGALGSWLLIRRRNRGSSRAATYRYGALLGVVFGWLCLPVSVLTLAIPFVLIFRAGGLGLTEGFVVWFDPRNPIVIIGALTGLLMGVAIAWIVTRCFAERLSTR